jgi:hypothetical protein
MTDELADVILFKIADELFWEIGSLDVCMIIFELNLNE